MVSENAGFSFMLFNFFPIYRLWLNKMLNGGSVLFPKNFKVEIFIDWIYVQHLAKMLTGDQFQQKLLPLHKRIQLTLQQSQALELCMTMLKSELYLFH